jgi:hypothetical protein
MTKKALVASLLILGLPTAVQAKGHILPSETPGVSDTYIFPGSQSTSNALVREDDTGGVAQGMPGGLTEAQILARLQQEGYGEVSDLRPTLGGDTALAVKVGKGMGGGGDKCGKVFRLG